MGSRTMVFCQERVSNGARIDDDLIALSDKEEQRSLDLTLDPLLELRLKIPRYGFIHISFMETRKRQ